MSPFNGPAMLRLGIAGFFCCASARLTGRTNWKDLSPGRQMRKLRGRRGGFAPVLLGQARMLDADVAQWQSGAFVKHRLWVRFPPSAFANPLQISLLRLLRTKGPWRR